MMENTNTNEHIPEQGMPGDNPRDGNDHVNIDISGCRSSGINHIYNIDDVDDRIHSNKRELEGKIRRLQWNNLTYSVDVKVPRSAKRSDVESGVKKPTKKQILSGINVYAESKEMLAILGHSGAGKTTMLDALSGRLPSENLSADFTMNNQPTTISKAMEQAAYVQQSDALYPMLTVYETIMYAAKLKINKTQAEREEIVQEILDDLQLNKARDTRIGNDVYRGVSGGERRRVTIGVEIIARPDIIILDEPTSGLDSSTAAHVCRTLRSLAKQGRIVICTIHQPSARLISMFDRMTFLGDGRTIYSGKPSEVGEYFQREFQITMPSHVNVAEFVLDVAENALAGNDQMNMKMLQERWDSYYGEFITCGGEAEAKPKLTHTHNSSGSLYANSTFSEIPVLTHRAVLNITRNPELLIASIGVCILNGIILGLLYRDVFDRDLATVTLTGFIAFTLAVLSFSQADALPIFLQEREILDREISQHSYRVTSYTAASSLAWPLLKFLPALLYTICSFFLIGLKGAGLFFFIAFVLTVAQLAAQAFCFVISVNAPNLPTASVTAISCIAFMFLFSGYFIPPGEMPDYLAWIRYLSLFFYPINSLVIAIFEERNGEPDVIALFDTYQLHGQSKWEGIGILIAFYIAYRIFFCLLLWLKTRRPGK
eukprot:Clim_evm10s10 gene=Clim_evmTU10s10